MDAGRLGDGTGARSMTETEDVRLAQTIVTVTAAVTSLVEIGRQCCRRISVILVRYGISGMLLVLGMTSCVAPTTDVLMPEERLWLSQQPDSPEVLFGYEAPPNAYHDDQGRYTGLLVDFLREIESRLAFTFAAKDFSTWDELIEYAKTARGFVIIGIARTDAREKYLSFTDPFVKIPYVIVTRKDGDLKNMDDLIGQQVCTVANYAVNDFIALHYANIAPVTVADNLEGLRAVSTGICDAMVVNQMYATYLIGQQGITNLKIVGESGYLNRLSAATSIKDQQLFEVLERAVDRIDIQKQRALYQRWVSPADAGLSRKTLALLRTLGAIAIAVSVLLWLWTVALRKRVKRQTRQLRESEEQFRSVVQDLPALVCRNDRDGVIVFVNYAYCEYFKKTQDELIGRSFFELVPEDERATVRANLSKLSVSEPVMVHEHEVLAAGGAVRHQRWMNRAICDDNGTVVLIQAYGEDVTERKQAEQAMKDSQAFLRTIFDNSDVAIFVVKANGTGDCTYEGVNQRYEQLFGLRNSDVVGKSSRELASVFGKSAVDEMSNALDDCVTTKVSHESEFMVPIEGKEEWWFSRLTPMLDDAGAVGRIIGSSINITERRNAEQGLRLAASVFDSTAEGVVITDAEGNIVDVNRAFSGILGYSREEVIGRNPRLWRSERHDEAFYRAMWRSLAEAGQWRGEIWNRRKDGLIFPEWQNISAVVDSKGNLTHYVSVFSDISQVKQSQEQLEHLAHHDALTDLPNRLLLNERLKQAIKHADRQGDQLVVIFLDIDRFKHINDSFGHSVGDRLLQEVSRCLIRMVRKEDTVARIGGDEFVMLLAEIGKTENAGVVAQKILSAFDEPFYLNDQEIRVTASLGICLYPRDGSNESELLRNADAAMYRSKDDGRNTYHFYTEELTRNAFERVRLENSLRQALEREELYLVYQSQWDLHSSLIVGVEALIRWQHPELGMVPPNKFIPLAEECGLIRTIGEWVLKTACTQGMEWMAQGFEFGRMAVNVAGPQLQRGHLPDVIRSALTDTGFPASRLELEVTENFVMQQVEPAIDQLNELRALGVTLAIDDFGTGYSSLSYLKQLPIHKLKIDQSFVRDIPDEPNDMAIAEAIIAMGKSLGLNVIAEGVESAEQATFLQTAGCQEAQGYFYSKPVSAEVYRALSVGGLG